MDEQFKMILKYLRMNNLIENYEKYMKLGTQRSFSNAKFLKYIFEAEYKIKKENSRILRLKRAHIPEQFVIETFPFKQQPKLNKKKVLSVYDSLLYVTEKQNVIWVGPTGCGKTGLATSFLINAINHGYTGRYIQFPELISILYKSIADHSEEKVIRTFASYDALVIDEAGYIQMEPAQVGLFFTLMHKRHKNKTTLITSNLGFSEWNSFLKNEHLTAALIDRLTEKSYVFNMKNCISLRAKLQ